MKICIAHFRTGLTDGVSLQIDERARILSQFGHKVFFVGDTNSPNADLKLPYFDYKKNLKIVEIQQKAFDGRTHPELNGQIEMVAEEIEKELTEFWKFHRFSLIFVHNIFSLPVCLPATVAFYNFLRKNSQVKAIGVHHDFYWDPPRAEIFKTGDSFVSDVLEKYFPPKIPNLSHTELSVWESDMLLNKRGIKSEVITDTFDFDQKPWSVNKANIHFKKDVGLAENDFVVLLASRIRKRKGIELGIEFVARLNKMLRGKKAVLLLPNDYSPTETEYISFLKKKAESLGVSVLWIQDWVGSEEEKDKGIKKYSLWDTYIFSDCIIYPSLWEGFGNQFLEAVFARKPIVIFEYPVYETDIKPAGFKVIDIGNSVTKDKNGLAEIPESKYRKAANALVELVSNSEKLKTLTDHNFSVGKTKFNTRVQLHTYLTKSSEKYLKTDGIRTFISPLILSGRLISCGVLVNEAYDLAESIIAGVPETGIKSDDFFKLVLSFLPKEVRLRYVTLELAKSYLNSEKSKSPLFIFLGGLVGKSSLSNLVVQHLGINQPISFDNEKYNLATPGKSKSFFLKASYESPTGYIRTIAAMYPFLEKMIDRNLYDYGRYRKWCYFWEGIYLSTEIVARLKTGRQEVNFLSVFNLPKFEDVRKQYILRWQQELGVEKLKKRKNLIDKYLENVSAIRSHITENLDPVASFVIESPILEERLYAFYAILYQRLKDITDKETPGWVKKICDDPTQINNFRKFLKS